MAWTQYKIALLTKLWANGQSASVIAGEIGGTRNAVMGKVHRLGLAGRTTAVTLNGRASLRPQGPRPPCPPRGPRDPRPRTPGGARRLPGRFTLDVTQFQHAYAPRLPQTAPTKREMHNMLAEAVRNTAKLAA